MPTPLEIFMNPIILILLGMYVMLMLWEAILPAQKLPQVPYWKVKGLAAMVIYILISAYLPMLYAAYLPAMPLIDLTAMYPIASASIGILVYELALYGWHRNMHGSNFLWKVFHQMHHSAERIDTFGAFYFSPFDMIGFTVMITVCFSFLVGLSPLAITIVLLTTNFFSLFQHTNIKTPVWLGYVIQRPESHAAHHSKDVHTNNFCDLPIIDILLGTFNNPQKMPEDFGFYPGASSEVFDMLLFRDISQKAPKNES